MSAHGNDPNVHYIRGGRFVCEAPSDAKCHIFPACECEEWSAELHDPPAEGHEDVQQDHCWIQPWMEATDLCDSYGPDGLVLSNDEFPDGPVSIQWEYDAVMWSYADDTDPTEVDR